MSSSQPVHAPTSALSAKFCGQCGHPCDTDGFFCTQCGTPYFKKDGAFDGGSVSLAPAADSATSPLLPATPTAAAAAAVARPGNRAAAALVQTYRRRMERVLGEGLGMAIEDPPEGKIGCRVVKVWEGTVASRAGVHAGDVIVASCTPYFVCCQLKDTDRVPQPP